MKRDREGRRQRRITRRRREILAAAARVFGENGYAGTTTRAIADAADVAEGTLYNYFGGKREILLAIAHEMEAPMEAILTERDGAADRETLVSMFEQALDISEEQLPFARAVYSEAWVDDGILEDFVIVRLRRVYERLRAFIAGGIEARILRAIDTDLGARLVMGMFAALVLPAVRGVSPLPSPQERRALAESVVDILLDGVRVPPL